MDPYHRKRKYSLRETMNAIMYIVKTGYVSVCAHMVIDSMRGSFPRLKKLLADGGYKGQKLIDEARQKLNAEFTVVLRPDESSKKFAVLPLRWIVERSFSWLENFRRIAMDYEFYSDTGVAMVQLAFCRLMYNKIYD